MSSLFLFNLFSPLIFGLEYNFGYLLTWLLPGQVATGLDNGIITMKKRECAVFTFTLPSELRFGVEGRDSLPPNSVVQFEVELVSWITVVNLSKDGGIVKKILEKGERDASPGDLDEVLGTFNAAYY